MIDEAGFPPGVFNLVNGRWRRSWKCYMSSHPDIDMVSFTGSTRAGRLILKNASQKLLNECVLN